MKFDRYTVPVQVVVPFGTDTRCVTSMLTELICKAQLDCGTYIGDDEALVHAALVKKTSFAVQDAKSLICYKYGTK